QGGSFKILIDAKLHSTVSTNAKTNGTGYALVSVPDGEHSLKLEVVGDGPVRIFGVSVERDQPGVIVDTLGSNGARARYQLLWNPAIFEEQLKKRNPDLVVIAYGTNESGDNTPIEQYETELRQVVERYRRVVPNASCLLIGPSDAPQKIAEGVF